MIREHVIRQHSHGIIITGPGPGMPTKLLSSLMSGLEVQEFCPDIAVEVGALAVMAWDSTCAQKWREELSLG